MTQDSESVHATDHDIVSHQLLETAFGRELTRPRRAAPPGPSLASGIVLRPGEVFAVPGNPPIITEGTRLMRFVELVQSQPELAATAVFTPEEILQIARLYRERGLQPPVGLNDSPTVSELVRWIDQLGGIRPVKVDA